MLSPLPLAQCSSVPYISRHFTSATQIPVRQIPPVSTAVYTISHPIDQEWAEAGVMNAIAFHKS